MGTKSNKASTRAHDAAESDDEPLETVTVVSASKDHVGLWDRSPAYRDVGEAVGDTFEIFVRNEPITLPLTMEVQTALKAGRLVEASEKTEAAKVE